LQEAINEVRECLTDMQEHAFEIENALLETYGLNRSEIESRVEELIRDPHYDVVDNRLLALIFIRSREHLKSIQAKS